MIAKAMAKSDVSAADKALIDKLAAEFSDELGNLGVRVSNLERNADNVKWNGQARYRYWSQRYEQDNGSKKKQNTDQMNFRLEPSAEVNNNWHVKARIECLHESEPGHGCHGQARTRMGTGRLQELPGQARQDAVLLHGDGWHAA